MTMADIWLTAAAEAAFSELRATAPDQADAVSEAINDITAADGRRIDLPGAPAAEPFLAIEPRQPDAPAVIYRHAANGEPGKWLVVSLMNREDYRAARQAERALASSPPAVRELINGVVAGTVAEPLPSLAAARRQQRRPQASRPSRCHLAGAVPPPRPEWRAGNLPPGAVRAAGTIITKSPVSDAGPGNREARPAGDRASRVHQRARLQSSFGLACRPRCA